MQLSVKQKQGYDLFMRPDITTICFGGGAGGAKSTLVCFLAILTCSQYPKIKWGLFRKTMANLKKTLYPTMREMLDIMGMVQDVDYKDRVMSAGFIEFANGSLVEFNELDWRPSDPQMAQIGGREYTYAAIDEAGEIVEKAFDIVRSRIGRCMNKEYGLVPKLICTCNPSSNFLRDKFYEHYEKSTDPSKAEGYAIWEDGTYWDYETETYKTAYSCFVRSTAFDNPFLDKNYIPTLMKQPPSERKRLLGGDWNFNSDENSLFPIELLMKATTYELPEIEYRSTIKEQGIISRPTKAQQEAFKVPIFKKFIGVDVADKGKDRTVVSLIDNNVLVDQRVLDIGRVDPESPISRLYADKLEQYAINHGFTKQYAKNIWVEDNGVGAGLRDMMRTKGWAITAYTATAKDRSAYYYQMYTDMDAGEFKIYDKIGDKEELFRELGVHTYETVNLEPKVARKEDIKKELGRSPDLADSCMIANAARHQGNGYSYTNRFKTAGGTIWR